MVDEDMTSAMQFPPRSEENTRGLHAVVSYRGHLEVDRCHRTESLSDSVVRQDEKETPLKGGVDVNAYTTSSVVSPVPNWHDR